MSKKSTNGQTEKNDNNIKTTTVKNDFKIMMREALPAAREVLEQRRKDLSKEGWNDDKQKEFYKIMGVEGNVKITHRYKVCNDEGRQYKMEEDESTVIEFMRKSVDRMIVICDNLCVEDEGIPSPQYDESGNPTNEVVLKYGNFVNKTYSGGYSAYVNSNLTWNKKPDEYKQNLEINIGHNFIGKKLFGDNSKASTLCHEISHFVRFGYIGDGDKGRFGGVGTDDLPNDKDHKKDGTYITYANKLVENHDLEVFQNAYNFERYFQITKIGG